MHFVASRKPGIIPIVTVPSGGGLMLFEVTKNLPSLDIDRPKIVYTGVESVQRINKTVKYFYKNLVTL